MIIEEVIDPAMTIKVTGRLNKIPSFYLKNDGLKLYMLHTIKNTNRMRIVNTEVNLFIKCFHTYLRTSKRIGPHDEDIISIIIGSLLGDAYGSKRYAVGTRIVFKQSIIHKDYLF